MQRQQAGLMRLLAEWAHKDQLYGESSYMVHLDAVAKLARFMWPESEIHEIVAYGHDLLEDTVMLERDIRPVYGDEVTDAIVAMTKVEGESYEAYIEKVCSNTLALEVKLCDTLCNLKASKGTKRECKYRKQWDILLKRYYAAAGSK